MTKTPVRTGATEEAFDAAARRYDLLVGLNPGYREHLRVAADQLVTALAAPEAPTLLDLGCGSGISTQALLDAVSATAVSGRVVENRQTATILGVDASAGMLAQAVGKPWPAGVTLAQGAAEDASAATWPVPAPFDGVLAAYLFRNVAARDDAIAAVYDVLAPGGVLVVQDYSVAGTRVPKLLWTLVCWAIVIPLALIVSRDTRLYRYLWSSVLRFDSVSRFSDRLAAAGFTDIEVSTVDGWQRGILHTWRARRPS